MAIALDLKYLWIDALCIIQDSVEDCQRELNSMAEIYANSTITIAAVGATSGDSGFSLNRNKLPMVNCRVSPDTVISANFSGQEYILGSGTLHSKAWCFQEVQLSPRLLSCGAKELYFQCHHGIRREGNPSDDSKINKDKRSRKSHLTGPDYHRFCDNQSMTDLSEIYNKWYNYVSAYSWLDLTYSSDKLIALSGLASRFSLLIKDGAERPTPQDYVAGLWGADLLRGLMKDSNQEMQPVAFRAPSWSWAAIDSSPRFRPLKGEFCCEILEATATPVSELNPFGPVRSGKITIYGLVAPLPAMAFYQDEFDKESANARIARSYGRVVWWDWDVSRDLGSVCLLITAEFGLVLSPVRRPGVRTGIFQRAGIVDFRLYRLRPRANLGGDAMISDFEWEPNVVTLI